MDTAWSVMWNVTDETPANSERFLDRNGMEVSGYHSILSIWTPNNILQVFLQCKEAFPNMSDLLRNMMGLLGNIAEVSTSVWHRTPVL